MSKLVAHWLPHTCTGTPSECTGGTIELVPMTTKALREVKAVSQDHAEIDSIYANYTFVSFAQAILSAEHMVGKLGVTRSKLSWDTYIVAEFGGVKMFLWSEETFVDNLRETKVKFLFQNLACVSDEEAKKKLESMAADIKERAKNIDQRTIARVGARQLLVLYWRLRGSGLKSILTPEGPKEISWKLEGQAKALELLSEVAGDVDYLQLVEKSKRAFDMEDIKPRTPAEVLGKSETS